MDKVVVEIRGGVLTFIGSTNKCEIAIIDWDNIDGGQTDEVDYSPSGSYRENQLSLLIDEANKKITKNKNEICK